MIQKEIRICDYTGCDNDSTNQMFGNQIRRCARCKKDFCSLHCSSAVFLKGTMYFCAECWDKLNLSNLCNLAFKEQDEVLDRYADKFKKENSL